MIAAKEEPMDTFGRTSPSAGINLAHLGLATVAAFNKGPPGFPYTSGHLASTPTSRVTLDNSAINQSQLEGDTGERQDAAARQTRLLLQSQFAKNFMQMGGLHGLGIVYIPFY